MVEWNAYKNVRRLYKEDGDHLIFAYYNWPYSCQTVNLVNMLFEEIQKDFPEESANNIHIKMLPAFPYEIVLQFAFSKYEVKRLDLSQFEKMPDDFWN